MERRNAPQRLNPDTISKAMFVDELRRAVIAAGQRVGRPSSVFELSRVLGYQSRRIQYWMAGRGPAYTTMQRVYFELLKLRSQS